LNYVPPDAEGAFNPSSIRASEVRETLGKILKSAEFVASPQLRAFLTYIVEAQLAGNEHTLKGQTIGTVVLGRAEGYDSQRDPIVRVEANRLRRTLAAYYEHGGATDPVRVIVERGSYVPRFERLPLPPPVPIPLPPTDVPVPAAPPVVVRRWPAAAVIAVVLAAIAVLLVGVFLFVEARPASTAIGASVGDIPPRQAAAIATPTVPNLPSVKVMPFATPATGDIVERRDELASRMTVAIARFPELRVLATGDQAADFRMDGEISVSDRKSTTAIRLTAAKSAEVVWSASIDMPLTELMTSAGIDRIVAIATTAIAPQFGAIAQHLSHGDASPTGPQGDYDCLIDAQLMSHRFNDGVWGRLDACIGSLLARYPTFATAWASRALLRIGSYRLNPDTAAADAALKEAETMARHALELEPTNVRAMTAVAAVAFGKGDLEAARNIGLRAITANPYDPLSRSQYVLALLASGYKDQALQQSAAARRLDPAHISFYDSLDFLASFDKPDVANQLTSAVMADVSLLPYGAIARVLAYDAAGQVPGRDAAVKALYDLMPLFATDMPAALSRQFPPSPFTQRLLAALHEAGVGV